MHIGYSISSSNIFEKELAMLKQLTITLILVLAFAVAIPVQAIQNYGTEADAEVVTYTQPNEGTPITFDAKFWGDSFIWERETTSGYTIVEDEATGFWCYAVLNSAGYYIPSTLRVGIDNPGTTPLHLRRSPACLAQIALDLEEYDDMVADAYTDYQLHRDDPQEFRLAILFFDFYDSLSYPNGLHQPPDSNHYTQENVEQMFISEGVYKGVRSGRVQDPAQTPEGEEPFGSVRDWFTDMSSGFNDLVTITAGGPFNNGETLIINEIDDGEIQWLNMGYSKNAWRTQVQYNNQNVTFDYNLVWRKACDDGLANPIQPFPFDVIIYINAGKFGPRGSHLGGEANLGWVTYSELQSMPTLPSLGQSLQGYDPSTKLLNIGEFCHELMHACLGVPDPYDNNCADVVSWGMQRSPFAEVGGYAQPTLETCTYTRSTAPCRPNPAFLDQCGWCDMEEITEDSIGLVVTYSLSQPTIYHFDYDISHGVVGDLGKSKKGRFYLENRQMVTEADEDVDIDFNSYSMGSFDWGERRPERSVTGNKNNLHIWHREGWKDEDFRFSEEALNKGILLENADGVNDGNPGDGNDIFPGEDDITEFGPGTGEHHPFGVGGDQVPDGFVNDFLFGSSRDLIGVDPDIDVQGNYRELQTGFAVTNIKDTLDYIRCDVHTNYWGGEMLGIPDILYTWNEHNRNLWLGQGCVVKDGQEVVVMPSIDDENCDIYLDSDILIESGGSLEIFTPKHNNGLRELRVHCNGYRFIREMGGYFNFAPYPGEQSGNVRFIWNDGIIVDGGEFEMNVSAAFEGTGSGSAITATDAVISFVNCTFENYQTALDLDNCTGTISGCTFTDMTGTTISLSNCLESSPSLTFEGCTITGSTGPAIYMYNSNPLIDDCVITGNNGSSSGAAVYAYNSSPKLRDNDISGNVYAGFKAAGGGAPSLTTGSSGDPHRNRFSDNNTYTHTVKSSWTWAQYIQQSPTYTSINNGYNDFISSNGDYLISNYGYISSYKLYAMSNYWSISGGLDNGDFYQSGMVIYSPTDPTANYTSSADDEEAAFLLYSNAEALVDSNRVGDAVDLFKRVVDEYDGTYSALGAMRKVFELGVASGMTRNQLTSYFFDISGDSPENELQFYADRLANLSLIAGGGIEVAIGNYEEALENDLPAPEDLHYAIDYTYAELALLEAGNVDAVRENKEKIGTLHKKLNSLISRLSGMPEGGKDGLLPVKTEIEGCYPNPFNSTTTIKYSVANEGRVTLKIFDLSGREVVSLRDENSKAGNYSALFQGNGLASGVYLARLDAAGETVSMKVTLVK